MNVKRTAARGQVQVYTGNGKGKTTAAFGLAIRACMAGKKVFIGQFMKSKTPFLRCKSMVFGVQKVGFCIAKVWFLFFKRVFFVLQYTIPCPRNTPEMALRWCYLAI